MSAPKTVVWYGRKFEIAGIGWGRLPVWKFVKENGQPMTAEQFEALPPDGKEWLANAVQSYIDNISQAPAGRA